VDWDAFTTRFTAALADTLGTAAQETPWPEFNEDEVSGLIEQYSSPEWLEYR
jgi:lipoate-protein ligase A